MRLFAALSAVLCAVLSADPAAAQYPARPVRLVQKSAPFQSTAELTPVSLVGSFAFGLFVHPGLPA